MKNLLALGQLPRILRQRQDSYQHCCIIEAAFSSASREDSSNFVQKGAFQRLNYPVAEDFKMADTSEDEKKRQEEKARKKAEVRRRLEESTKSKTKKGGFMTPERKKKLRTLLRKKAAEELKREQERKAEERKKMIIERCGQPKSLDNANEATLQAVCKEYHKRIAELEDVKFDLEYDVCRKDVLINELTIQVNDLRGKFVKPTLKKVSKYEGKFEKLKVIAKTSEIDFRANLKTVKSNKFALGEEEEAKKQAPEWANK